MKKLGKLILVGALAFGTLQAKELFNLKAQDFEYTLYKEKNIKNAKYKLDDNLIVETNLRKSSKGFYYVVTPYKQSNDGYFNIELKKDLNNFSFNSNIIYHSQGVGYEPHLVKNKRYIKFIDQNGKDIILSFHVDGISINDKKFEAKTNNEIIHLNVNKTNNKLIVKINNSELFNATFEFSKLKFIDTSYISTNGRISEQDTYDKLNNMVLIENE